VVSLVNDAHIEVVLWSFEVLVLDNLEMELEVALDGNSLLLAKILEIFRVYAWRQVRMR
jgi:hypothetical protein